MLGTVASSASTAAVLSSVSGLVAAYSATAITPLANNTDMSAQGWTDLSGNGHHLLTAGTGRKYRTSEGPSGGPAIYFDGSSENQSLHVPASLYNALNTANEGHMYIGIKKGEGSSLRGWSTMTGGSSSNQHYGADAFWQIAENWGSEQRYSIGTPVDGVGAVAPLNQWRVLDIASVAATNGYTVKFDGVTQTVVMNTGSPPNDPAFGPRIFLGTPYAYLGTGYQPFIGWMAYWYLFNRKLTAPEDATVRSIIAANPSGVTAV